MNNYIIHNGVMYNTDELMHYGVVGMKWGQRRAKAKGQTYNYTSHGTKKYARKAAKARAKGNVEKAKKFEQYHKKSVELDRKMQKNALRSGTGKTIAKTVLNGPFGNRTYEAVKAAGVFKGKLANRILANIVATNTGPIGGSVARALYVRDEID